jgi:hypothetical protein
MLAAEATLKKAIFFFDELHFIDRPFFIPQWPKGAFSPHQLEVLFRERGVPLYVCGQIWEISRVGKTHEEFKLSVPMTTNPASWNTASYSPDRFHV